MLASNEYRRRPTLRRTHLQGGGYGSSPFVSPDERPGNLTGIVDAEPHATHRIEVLEPHRPALDPISRRSPTDLPCRVQDPDLWFAETPAALEQAKQFYAGCPARVACLAISRREPWGVWGGEIFDHGQIIARKRPRGRPRRNGVAA